LATPVLLRNAAGQRISTLSLPSIENEPPVGLGFWVWVLRTGKNKGPGRMYVNVIVRMTNGQLAGKKLKFSGESCVLNVLAAWRLIWANTPMMTTMMVMMVKKIITMEKNRKN